MARVREGSSRTVGDRPAKGNPEARITVRCPNRNCNIVYRVRARHAGRRARCAECGTRTLIPMPRTSVVENTPAPQRRLNAKPVERTLEKIAFVDRPGTSPPTHVHDENHLPHAAQVRTGWAPYVQMTHCLPGQQRLHETDSRR